MKSSVIVKQIIFKVIFEHFNIEISNVRELNFVKESLGIPNAWNSMSKKTIKEKIAIGIRDKVPLFGPTNTFNNYTFYCLNTKKCLSHKLLTFRQFEHIVTITPVLVSIQKEIEGRLNRKKVMQNIIDSLRFE